MKFLGCFRCIGGWENAGNMGNGYSFAHAKYGANPQKIHLFRDQQVFSNISLKKKSGLSVSKAPAQGQYQRNRFVAHLSPTGCGADARALKLLQLLQLRIQQFEQKKKGRSQSPVLRHAECQHRFSSSAEASVQGVTFIAASPF